MIEKLRKIFSSILLKIILGLVIISFILTSMGDYLLVNRKNYIIKINGHKITKDDLQRAFNEETYYQLKSLGNKFLSMINDKDYLSKIKKQIFSQLLNQVLFSQYIKKLNIHVSDKQVKEEIIHKDIFQNDGLFDNNKYNIIIENMGFTPYQYAENLRQKIAIRQLINTLFKSSFILKKEFKRISSLIGEEREIRQITFDIDKLSKKEKINFNEIKKFYLNNKKYFLESEKFLVNYIKLKVDYNKENVNGKEIKLWKKNHNKTDLQPIRYRFSIISTKKKSEADFIFDKLKHGVNFSELIKMKSINFPHINEVSDIGWFKSSSMPDLLKNAKLTKKGQFSNVIKYLKNFIILRLEDIQYKNIALLSENNMIMEIKKNKALSNFHKLSTKLNNLISKKTLSINKIASNLGLKIKQTKWFDIKNIPIELPSNKIKNFILNKNLIKKFKKEKNYKNNNILINDNNAIYVINFIKYKPYSIQSLNKAKFKISQILKNDKTTKKIKFNIMNLLNDLKSGKKNLINFINIEQIQHKKLHRNLYYQLNEEKILHNDDYSYNKKLVYDIFNVSRPIKNKPSWGISKNNKGDIILFAVDRINSIPLSYQQRYKLKKFLINQNAKNFLNTILFNLQNKAKIEYGSINNM